MRSLTTKIPITLILALVASLALAASASAGAYKVHTCQYPDGSSAPTDGWVSAKNPASISYWATADYCTNPAGFLVANAWQGLGKPTGTTMAWTFSPGVPILAYDVWRAATMTSSSPAYADGFVSWWTNSPSGQAFLNPNLIANGTFGSLVSGISESNRVSRTALETPVNTSSMVMHVGCGGSGGLSCDPISFDSRIFRGDFVLEDNTQPTFTVPSGTMLAGGELKGIVGLQFDATDTGSGIYDVRLEIDGVLQPGFVPNAHDGRCVAKSDTNGMLGFGYIHPCPTSTSVSFEWNTHNTTDGIKTIRVLGRDAAGNQAVVLPATQVTVKNQVDPPRSVLDPPDKPCVGGGCGGNNGGGGDLSSARFVQNSSKGRSIRVKHGRKAPINSRLVDAAGTPIVGAQVDIWEHINVAGAVERQLTSLLSDGDGWVRFLPRTTANKLITFKWSAVRGSTQYNTTDATKLIVDGALKIRAVRRKVKPGKLMKLTGKLYGEGMPKSVPIQVQLLKKKKWQVVAIVNTKKNGTFKWNYRFKYTRYGNFRFRTIVRKSSDLAVEPAKSRSLRIRVRR